MGTGTPGREAAFPSSPQRKPRTEWVMGADPGVRVGLFPCSARRPFPRPGLAQRNWRRAQGRSRTRVSAPAGLVLDGPEHGARLGRRRDAKGSVRIVVGEPTPTEDLRSGETAASTTARSTSRGRAAHSPRRPSNTVTGPPSNSVSRLTSSSLSFHRRGKHRLLCGRSARLRAVATPRTDLARPLRL